MSHEPTLLIIQPYIPRYRVPFFHGLVKSLDELGIRCRVSVSAPSGPQAARRDAAEAWWTIPRAGSETTIRGRPVTARGSRPARRSADMVITGLSATTVDTWAALAEGRVGRRPVGLWGHVRNYVGSTGIAADALRRHQARAADHVFAYTPGGAAQATEWGLPPRRITTVMNTVQVDGLLAARDAVGGSAEAFAARHGLINGKVAVYIGGLDLDKRIDVLADALEHIWRVDPAFRLLLGGRGADRRLLDQGIRRGQVVDMGYVGDDEKALMGSVATALAMPGRVGLVAIEAMALGLPIVTTPSARHAPEWEYLPDDMRVVSAGDDGRTYGDLLIKTARIGSARPQTVPSMTDMISNFVEGVLALAAGGGIHVRSTG